MEKQKFLNQMARGKAAKRLGVGLSAVCPECMCLMTPVYENNGFQAPDPTHYEVVGVNCSNCGHKE